MLMYTKGWWLEIEEKYICEEIKQKQVNMSSQHMKYDNLEMCENGPFSDTTTLQNIYSLVVQSMCLSKHPLKGMKIKSAGTGCGCDSGVG